MHTISLIAAKAHLSRIVGELISGKEREVVISLHGKPMVRMVAIHAKRVSRRIGLAKGQFIVPTDIDTANADIATCFCQ